MQGLVPPRVKKGAYLPIVQLDGNWFVQKNKLGRSVRIDPTLLVDRIHTQLIQPANVVELYLHVDAFSVIDDADGGKVLVPEIPGDQTQVMLWFHGAWLTVAKVTKENLEVLSVEDLISTGQLIADDLIVIGKGQTVEAHDVVGTAKTAVFNETTWWNWDGTRFQTVIQYAF